MTTIIDEIKKLKARIEELEEKKTYHLESVQFVEIELYNINNALARLVASKPQVKVGQVVMVTKGFHYLKRGQDYLGYVVGFRNSNKPIVVPLDEVRRQQRNFKDGKIKDLGSGDDEFLQNCTPLSFNL